MHDWASCSQSNWVEDSSGQGRAFLWLLSEGTLRALPPQLFVGASSQDTDHKPRMACLGLRVLPSPAEHLKQPQCDCWGVPVAALPCYLPVPPSGCPLCHCFIACWDADICGHGPTSAELNTTTSMRSWSPTRFKVSQHFLHQQRWLSLFYSSLCAISLLSPPKFV